VAGAEGEVPAPGSLEARAPAPASGPLDAASLAREQGLAVEDSGASVLLSGAGVRARFHPGSAVMRVDGNPVSMASPARREGASLVVPPEGVAAVRQAVASARARKAASDARVAALPRIPAVVAPAPVAVAAKPPPPARAEPGPGWVVSVSERPWRWIVVHHSDDTCGCCSKYDACHRQKGWENGCGYHFVVGNGTMSADGQVEPSDRWKQQLQGAHAKTPDNRYNDFGIGVVLVGDFERGAGPSRRQYDALVRLVRWLMERYGIPPEAVLRHGDTKATACPGKNFPWTRFLADVSAPSAPVATPP
jgi:hypothetical protein